MKYNYPLFDQYQLIDYDGDNNVINTIKKKYIQFLYKKKTKYLIDLESSVKEEKPYRLIINPKDVGKVIETLKSIKGRKKYFIPTLYNNKIKQGNYIPVYEYDRCEITSEQNEYLIKNFMFNPIDLGEEHKIKIGKTNVEFLNKQGIYHEDNLLNVKSLIGETENFFHLSNDQKKFFLKKDDNDLQHPFFSLVENVEFDHEYYNNLCQWSEWIEKGYKLKDHQIYAIKSILYHKKLPIFDRAGTGKTMLSIVAALASGANKILVVTQLNLKHQWIEFIEYFNESVSSFGNDIDELDVFAKFHVIHYNQLDEDRDKKKNKKNKYAFYPKYDFKQFNYDFIISDEAHEAKNINGIRGKHINQLINSKSCIYSVPLTASPFESNEQLYSLFFNYGIDVNGLIPINEWNWEIKKEKLDQFKIRYCDGVIRRSKDNVFVRVRGNSNSHELAQRLKYYHLCRTPLDIKGFPELNVYNLDFKLDAASHSEYIRYKKELKDHYGRLKEKNDNMMVNEDLPIFAKIREFLALKATDQTINLARSLVKDGKKVIIFTHFQSEFDKITQYLPDEAVWMHVTKKHRWKRKENIDIINEFKYSKDKNIIVGNLKSLGTGQNLPQADFSILNTPNWAYGEHMQGMSRPRRLNRLEPVGIYMWLIKDTEIEKVLEVNDMKRRNVNILLGLPEDYY